MNSSTKVFGNIFRINMTDKRKITFKNVSLSLQNFNVIILFVSVLIFLHRFSISIVNLTYKTYFVPIIHFLKIFYY